MSEFEEQIAQIIAEELDEQMLGRLRAKAKSSGKKRKAARAQKKADKQTAKDQKAADKQTAKDQKAADKQTAKDQKAADKQAADDKKAEEKSLKNWVKHLNKNVILPLYNTMDVDIEELAPISWAVAVEQEDHPWKVVEAELFNNVLLPNVKQAHSDTRNALVGYLMQSSIAGESDQSAADEAKKASKKGIEWAKLFNNLGSEYVVDGNVIGGARYMDAYGEISKAHGVHWISELEEEDHRQSFQAELEDAWADIESEAFSSR